MRRAGSGAWVVAVVCLVALQAGAQEAPAQDPGPPAAQAAPRYTVEGTTLTVDTGQGTPTQVDLPCAGQALAQSGDALYVACGEAGLLVLGLADPARPEPLDVRDLGGTVTGLFAAGDRLWAEVTRVEARPIGEVGGVLPSAAAPILTPATPVAITPATTPPARGSVVETRSGEVVVDLGTAAGLDRGDHVELFRERSVELGAGQTAIREHRVAVGRVTAVTESRAEVALGMNERVPAGALARPTELDLTGDRWDPPRLGGIWDLAFMVRPFLSLGTLGVGSISSLELGYWFDAPVAIELVVDPIGLGLADEGNIVSLAGNVLASYDAEAFQVGLGFGWSAINDELDGEAAESDGGGFDVEFDRVRSGLSIAQVARLGARDGLHLRVLNSFLLQDEEFVYGGTSGTAQFPLATDRRMWLLVRGGGGRAGYVFGEIGLRVLLDGSGDRGSLFVTPTLGGAHLRGEEEIDCDVYDPETGGTRPGTCVDDIDYGGPMVGFGMEWRW